MKIRLKDSNFSHAYTIGNGDLKIIPKNFQWDRSGEHQDITFFTDRNLSDSYNINDKSKINIASIFEPPVINPNPYHYITEHYDDFDVVLTYNKDLLNLNQKFQFCPHAGCWIEEKNQKIYKKKQNLSVIFSNKTRTDGHKLRHDVINKFKSNIDFIAGNGYQKIKSKLDALKNFRYQIIVENCQLDYYFTEKLIDCFITGTIPIYWGCPSIGKFFDLDGMYCFNNLDELETILNNISEQDYNDRIEYVKKNFEIAKEYTVVENWIFDNIIKENK
jgi:hypothetical protein